MTGAFGGARVGCGSAAARLLVQLVREFCLLRSAWCFGEGGRRSGAAARLSQMREEGRELPRFVENELRGYLSCGLLGEGFVRCVCQSCGDELLVAPCPSGAHEVMIVAGGAMMQRRLECPRVRKVSLP